MKYLLLLGLLLFLSCSDHNEPPYVPPYSYYVAPLKQSDTSLTISLTIRDKSSDSITILLPPIYADNPLLEERLPTVTNISITESYGDTATFIEKSISFDQFQTRAITFDRQDSLYTLTYEVSFNYKDTTILTPSISPQGGYLQGNYLFALPYKGEELVQLWRGHNHFEVSYKLPQTMTLFGDPTKGWQGYNFYQLLFSTSLLNGTIMTSGSIERQYYSFVSPLATPFPHITEAKEAFEGIMYTILASFKPATPAPITVIFDSNKSGGLEGTFAFSIQSSLYETSPSLFNMVLAHEALHWWIGVYTGDYDDPWWKEGTTDYLGFLVSTRAGFTNYQDMANEMLRDYSSDPIIASMALSDPSLRYILYNDLGNLTYYRLVYGKGGQFSMILDAEIRKHTQGKMKLEDVLNTLFENHWHSAFTRNEYLKAISSTTGYDAEKLFTRYVDQSGSISQEILDEALATISHYEHFATTSQQSAQIRSLQQPWFIEYYSTTH